MQNRSILFSILILITFCINNAYSFKKPDHETQKRYFELRAPAKEKPIFYTVNKFFVKEPHLYLQQDSARKELLDTVLQAIGYPDYYKSTLVFVETNNFSGRDDYSFGQSIHGYRVNGIVLKISLDYDGKITTVMVEMNDPRDHSNLKKLDSTSLCSEKDAIKVFRKEKQLFNLNEEKVTSSLFVPTRRSGYPNVLIWEFSINGVHKNGKREGWWGRVNAFTCEMLDWRDARQY
ncbi:MAG: hypothetical protein OCC49_19820 [Fibrobacterales bacterium]